MSHVARFMLIENCICGSIYGELYSFRFPALYNDEKMVEVFKHNEVEKLDMALSKQFDCMTSMITSINILDDKKVFVTGLND